MLLQDFWHFLEEVTLLHLLDGGTPSNVVRKHVGEDGNAHGNCETAKEEKEELEKQANSNAVKERSLNK